MERFALKALWVSVGLMSPLLASAAPEGGVIESGNATISHSGPHTQINQASQTAVLGWDQFNVGADESVSFSVPNASSVTLNNIYDQHPSQIMGQVSSNGQLILANPNGLFFGANSQLNIGALVATTSDVDLTGDQLTLNGASTVAGIDHQGTVNASGSVAYYAPRIDLSGSITSSGDIRLSNHTQGTITLTDSGIGFDVSDSEEQRLSQQGIKVTGSLRSDGGYIGLETAAVNSLYDAALNVEGLVSADSLVNEGGQVVLTASEGTALVSGDISADSLTAAGGEIRLAGNEVELAGDAIVSANGATGGGEVFIGGGWDYTSGPDLARRTVLNENTQVSADSTENGHGGDVWIWSEEQTVVQGGLSARGSGELGNGGFVETSSMRRLIVETAPDIGSDKGSGGEWLLDPQGIFVLDSPTGDLSECPPSFCDNIDVETDGDETVLYPENNTADIQSLIWVQYIETTLENGSDVTLQTTTSDSNNFIAWYAPMSLGALGADGSGKLTLQTSGAIYISDNISSTTDDLTLVLDAGTFIYTFDEASQFTVDALEINTPRFTNNVSLSIAANTIITQDEMDWYSQGSLTFSSGSDISSNLDGGALNFVYASNNATITLGNVGKTGFGIGSLNLIDDNMDIVFDGTQIELETLRIGRNASIISTDALNVSINDFESTGSLNWSANDDLVIENGNNTSSIINTGRLDFNMSGNSLTLDNVSLLGASSGDLAVNDAFSVNIFGSTIQQTSIQIDSDRVNSYNGLTLDAAAISLADGVVWTSEGDLEFADQSNLDSLVLNGGVAFDLNTNNLAFGSVGQGVNGIGGVTVSDVDVLTLTDSIVINSDNSSLDFGSGQVNSIQLNGNASLITQNADISLSPIIAGEDDPVSGEEPTLSISSGSGDIEIDSLLNIGNVSISSTGEITASGNMTLQGDSLVIDAGQFNVDSSDDPIRLVAGATIDLNAPIDSATGTTSGLLLEAGNRIDIGAVGAGNALGEFQLKTGGTVSLNGSSLSANTLSIEANNLNLTTDTEIDISGASMLFNETDITGDGGQKLNISATGASVELDAVNVGALTVDANQLTLKNSISTANGNLDFSLADSIILSADTSLNAGVAGDLTLSDNISSISDSYELSLFIQQGDLVLGDQSGSTDKLGSLVLSDDSPVGTNSTTKGVSVLELLDLSNAGVLSVSENTEFSSDNGNVVLTGTSIDASGSNVTISAGNQAILSEIDADGFTLVSSTAVLDSDISALNRLDMSQAGAIQLSDDVKLTGPLLLSSGAGSTSVNGNHALTLDAANQNLTMFDMGNTEALESLTVENAGTLQLAGGITTQGLDGIEFSGSRLDLTADTSLNTSSSSGKIDLSGIGINGEFTLTLNSGNGNVSLGDVGQDLLLASLAVEDASELELGGNIRTADTLLDLSNVESISLVNDVAVDTTAADGAIELGDTAIDGTFALSLSTGSGAVQLAEVGQSVALQSLALESTADLALDRDISVIDGLTLSGNVMTLGSALNSFGGDVTLASKAGLSMSSSAFVDTFGDASLSAEAGSINLGKVTSQTGSIDLVARNGSIYNTLGDFVSVEDTSINLTADRVNLIAGQDIGSGSSEPIVLDVPQSGSINLSFTAPLAYIVNINQSAVTANGKVFDVLSDSQRAALAAFSNTDLLGEASPWQDALAAPQPDSELFAITQPGYALASNVLLDEDTLVSDLPAVPNIRLRGGEWWLLYSRNSVQ